MLALEQNANRIGLVDAWLSIVGKRLVRKPTSCERMITSARIASAGRMRGGCCSAVGGGQELLPGILDHITIENIAPKIKWETCNALQMVSREWQRAIHNRSIYDARVRSQSTNAYLVLACLFLDEDWEVVLTLYSCKDGSSFRLPPVPLEGALETKRRTVNFRFDCICLDGKLYLWVTREIVGPSSFPWSCPVCLNVATHEKRAICEDMELWAFDLAGDKQWRTLKEETCTPPICELSYTALGGKLNRFRKTHNFIQIESYNPLSNIWSLIRTEPLAANSVASDGSFSEWEKEQLTGQLRTASLEMNSCYSEWKRQQLTTTLTTHNDHDHGSVMADQVYRKHQMLSGFSGIHTESLLFLGRKLARVVQHFCDYGDFTTVIQTYDSRTSTWSDWKSYPSSAETPLDICDCASTDDTLWATVTMCPRSGRYLKLIRSPLFSDSEVNGKWIDTEFSLESVDRQVPVLFESFLRPIYI